MPFYKTETCCIHRKLIAVLAYDLLWNKGYLVSNTLTSWRWKDKMQKREICNDFIALETGKRVWKVSVRLDVDQFFVSSSVLQGRVLYRVQRFWQRMLEDHLFWMLNIARGCRISLSMSKTLNCEVLGLILHHVLYSILTAFMLTLIVPRGVNQVQSGFENSDWNLQILFPV